MTKLEELRERCEDLLKQATAEHSHFYTASVMRDVLEVLDYAERLQRERDEAVEALREAGEDICWASCRSYTPRHSSSHTKIINALSHIEGGQNELPKMA